MYFLKIYDGDRLIKEAEASEVVKSVQKKGLLNPGDTLMIEDQECVISSISGTTEGDNKHLVVNLEELEVKSK